LPLVEIYGFLVISWVVGLRVLVRLNFDEVDSSGDLKDGSREALRLPVNLENVFG
jgi:hypothetical protein